MTETKICTSCGIDKPRTDFHKQGEWLRGKCKKCLSAYHASLPSSIARSRKSAKTVERETLFVQGLKRCARCESVQALSNFRSSSKSKTGVTSYCKPCEKQYAQTSHQNRAVTIKRWIFNYLKEHSCVDCGDTEVLSLDFDHIQGRKRFNIAHAFMIKNMTIDKLKTEVAKCDVRCRKCHVIKTHIDNNSWKYQMYLEDQKG